MQPVMTDDEYREALQLLSRALDVVGKRDSTRTARLRKRIRALSLEVDLLRTRLLQPPARYRRN